MMPTRVSTLYGRSTATTGRGGVWAQARGLPRDRNWWRFNRVAFAGFVAFLDRMYPGGARSSHEAWGGGSWIIARDAAEAIQVRVGRGQDQRPGEHLVTGRIVRRHGVSEAFMNALAEYVPSTPPARLHRFPLTVCRHGHSLVDPRNVYTVSRMRRGVEEVERRCRICNRERVAQHRRRVKIADAISTIGYMIVSGT
jgi:hypothetical protein